MVSITERNSLITKSDGKNLEHCPEKCIENDIFSAINKTMYKEVYERSVRKFGFLVDENSMTIESAFDTISLLQLFSGNVHAYLTRYSHSTYGGHEKRNECSFAYSMDTRTCLQCTYVHMWPRLTQFTYCLLYTSPSPRDATLSRMPSSA